MVLLHHIVQMLTKVIKKSN
ncbi:hypothetical protein C370_07300 [Cryptococcus neoformans A1-35-8]|nr:hypothetical protein C370_07300 [Cryptococcus neoformans var. grubii A1-35-8]